MDFKILNTFLHVAEQGSFTKAGNMLGYSQSTISFHIRQLEEELGFPVFERINHTVTLTERGHEVLAFAHDINRMTAELKAGSADQEITGHITLAMSDSLCNTLLDDSFIAFRHDYPGISLKIIPAGTDEMFRMINHNEVDAILTLDSPIYDSDYVIVKEAAVQVHFVASADHPLAFKKNIQLTELVEEPFFLTEKGMSYRRILDEQLAQRAMQIHPVLEIGSTDLICQLITKNTGISFLPDFVTERYVKDGSICRLDVPELELVIRKQLLHHVDKWLSPQLKMVLKYCSVWE